MPIAPALPPPPGSSAAAPPAHNGTAYWIKVSAQRDGSFTVTNARERLQQNLHTGQVILVCQKRRLTGRERLFVRGRGRH